MRMSSVAIGLCMMTGPAWSGEICPDVHHTCIYTVDTNGTSPVRARSGGYTVEKRVWVDAPDGKYFVNPSVTPANSLGQNAECDIDGSDGVQERDVSLGGNDTVPMRFVKKYLIVAHAESNAGQNARTMCVFNAQISALPN